MEKILTLLWRPEGQAPQAHADALLQRAAPRLRELGAAKLKVCVEDDAVADGEKLRMNPVGPPKAAMVSYWVDCAEDRGPLERVLAGHGAALASWLVVESVPTPNTAHPNPGGGARTEGFSQVTCIQPREDLAYEEFIHLWHTLQRPCATETQSTFGYVRNEFVRRLAGEAPPWTAVVEELFPIEALTDPRAFYDAVGDEEKFRANLERMIETVQKFLKLDATDVTAMSEYVFEG